MQMRSHYFVEHVSTSQADVFVHNFAITKRLTAPTVEQSGIILSLVQLLARWHEFNMSTAKRLIGYSVRNVPIRRYKNMEFFHSMIY